MNSHFDTFNKTLFSIVVGDTPDISEYTDFAFWDWVWAIEGAGLSETILAKFVGVTHSIRNAMSYYLLKETDPIITRSTVQPVTLVERKNDFFIEKILHYFLMKNDVLFSDNRLIINTNFFTLSRSYRTGPRLYLGLS